MNLILGSSGNTDKSYLVIVDVSIIFYQYHAMHNTLLSIQIIQKYSHSISNLFLIVSIGVFITCGICMVVVSGWLVAQILYCLIIIYFAQFQKKGTVGITNARLLVQF